MHVREEGTGGWSEGRTGERNEKRREAERIDRDKRARKKEIVS